MEPIHTETDLDRLRRASQAYATVAAWGHTGLFKALADGRARSADELPGDSRALTIAATVLGHLGLLIRQEDEAGETRWSLSTSGRTLHENGALSFPRSSGIPELGRLPGVLESGGPVPDASGRSLNTSIGVRADDREGSHQFMDMLHRRSDHAATESARLIAGRLEAGHVLDLGGGHGRYAHELIQQGFTATLFDQPVCVEYAEERYRDSMGFLGGDFHTDDLGGPYDAVLGSNIVHGLGEPAIRALQDRLREVIRPGGLLVWKDMFLDDTGVGPTDAAIFGLSMLLYTQEGRSYSVGEMSRWLKASGFPTVEHIRVPNLHFSLLIAS